MPINHQAPQLKIVAQGSNRSYVWADILVSEPRLRVSARLAAAVLDLYPTLELHACKSSRGTCRFGQVIEGALLPHLVEHLAIELLVQAMPGQAFAGNTSSLEEFQSHEAIQRVKVNAPKAGLPKLQKAVEIINGLLASLAVG